MFLKKLADEIKLAYHNGMPTDDSPLDDRQLYLMITKSINKLIKAETLSYIGIGEETPPNAALATYDVDILPLEDNRYTEVKQSEFGVFRYTVGVWSTENEEAWQDGTTNLWQASATAQSITLAITEIDGDTYRIKVSGYILPLDSIENQLREFLSAPGENVYFTLSGVSEGKPSVFAKRAMNELVVTKNAFQFTYRISDTFELPEDVFAKVGVTNNFLSGSSSSSEVLDKIFRFENIPKASTSRAKLTLPAQPIALRRGMGIWRIYNPADPFASYIPVQAGEMSIATQTSHTGLKNMLGRMTAYEWHSNNTVIFNKLVIQMPKRVSVQLVVVDPEKVGEYDLLPIPADMEQHVVLEVLEQLRSQVKPDLAANKNPEV